MNSKKILIQFGSLALALSTFLTSAFAYNFCGGTNARNLTVSYGPSNFNPGYGANPVNNNTLHISKTKGLKVMHPFQNGGVEFFRCPNAPTVTAGVCSSPWVSALPATVAPQNPTDCGCRSYLQVDLSGTNVSPQPTLPQNVAVGFWNDATISTADINNFQSFPNSAFNSSYSKILSLTQPGAFSSTLLLMYTDQTVVTAGNGRKEIEVIVPYRPNLALPATLSTMLVYAGANAAEIPLIDCLWVANQIPVQLVP